VAELFGDRVESLEMRRRRFELDHFANPVELRDFFKANHPVAIAAYRQLAGDPARAVALDRALLEMAERWQGDGDGDGGSRGFTQEALIIVARRRRSAPRRS
jgi:hypothetical protein